MAEHKDKFFIAVPYKLEPELPSDYGYRRNWISKEYWITHNGNDVEPFNNFSLMQRKLDKLRREE